ncbi:hypothetical protein M0811_00003 [Anaeramoeba ignava]|uniref:BTB domain-containing protein n=1 Tax=Anaeramoeba ignava TaxID=1746090 RepID=A0A9Q0LN93_ANAIG|nr:hypothetical protein M0811_00003 [Anaeramoeba ignava]
MENYLNLEKLSNDLKNLFQNQNQNEHEEESYFDFEIICEENKTSFKTHKSILSSRSHYFKSLFKSKMKEFQENKMILKDVSSSILSSILNYLYSGKIEINLENAIQILIFSSKYLIDELIETSSKFIKKNFQIETVIDIIKLSESMNLSKLLYFSYQFISENFRKFIQTSFFLELEENHLNSILSNDEILISEFEIFQSIIKWGKHKSNIKKEKEKLQNQISNFIDKIRFIDFSKQELAETLEEDLIPNELSQKLTKLLILKTQENEEKLKQFIQKENSLNFKTRFEMKFKSTIIQKQHFQKLREWINDDEFFSKMKLGYSAKQDGFSSNNWHLKCDNKGKTLIIIKTKDNFIFGGFTSVGFINEKLKQKQKQDQNSNENENENPFNHNQNSFNQNPFINNSKTFQNTPTLHVKNQNPFNQNEYQNNLDEIIDRFGYNLKPLSPNQDSFEEKVIEDIPDSKAFLFSLRNNKNNRKPEKLSIIEGKEKYAIDNNSIDRLVFGKNSNPFGNNDDLHLYSNLKSGYSNLGSIYNLPIGIKKDKKERENYLAGTHNKWKIQEIETYFI